MAAARPPRPRRLLLAGIGAGIAALALILGVRAFRPATGVASPVPKDPEQVLREAVAREPGNARARERLGTFYVETGRPFTGLWELQEARVLDPHDLVTGLGIARALEDGRFPELAAAELKALLARYPGRIEVCRRLADFYLATGRPTEAIRALRGAENLEKSPEALLVLGRACQTTGQYEEAEKRMQAAQRLMPTAAEPYYHLGRLYLDAGETAQAEQAFLAARVLMPSRPEPRVGLGLTYLKRGGPDGRRKAEAEFRAAIERAPNHAVAHTRLGQICLARKEYQAAAEHFVRALRAEKNVEACRGMAVALAAMGRPVEAQYHWGLFYTRKDLRPRSAEAFRKMQELDPERTEATLLLTETYVRMKQEQRGVALVEAALARHPDDPVLHERLAALHFASGNRRAARRACQTWLRLQPEAAAPHWILGKIAVDALRLEEGLLHLEQAVARDPKNPEYAYALAVALLKRPTPENRERARELLHRAIRLAPDVARYRNQFGLLLRADGDLEAALRQFLLSLDLDPHEPPVTMNVVSVARQLNRPHQVRLWSPLVRAVEDRTREELALWRAVWDHPTDEEALFRLAQFLIRTGELTKAQSQLEEALRLRPSWPEARQALETVREIVHVQRG